MKNPTLEFVANSIDNNIKRYKAGDKAVAFRNIGKMRIRSLSDADKKILVVAGEMLGGMGSLYEQMGMKQADVVAKADAIIQEHFINKPVKAETKPAEPKVEDFGGVRLPNLTKPEHLADPRGYAAFVARREYITEGKTIYRNGRWAKYTKTSLSGGEYSAALGFKGDVKCDELTEWTKLQDAKYAVYQWLMADENN